MRKLLLSVYYFLIMLVAGCAILTPTGVPPLTEKLGYSVPNIKGVTTVGLIKGTLEVEAAKLRVFDEMAELTLAATERVKAGLMDVLALLGLSGSAMLPVALRKLPAGAKSKEDYEAAGKMYPEEFKSKNA